MPETQKTTPRARATDIIRQLTATDWRVLDELLYLEECRLRRHPDKTIYTTPGTVYLAKKCGVTRWTISRSTQRLVALGALYKTRRRQIKEQFQTCMYRVAEGLKWRINKLRAFINPAFSRVRLNAHKHDEPYKNSPKPVAPLQKGGPPPPRRPSKIELLRAALGK